MEKKIKWLTEMSKALQKAEAEEKLIFLDFFNPQ